jgi:hypothetical protein
MTDLLLRGIREIDAVIEDREEYMKIVQADVEKLKIEMEEGQQRITDLKIEIEHQQEQRQKVIATRDFCESVLHQVRAALAMLHKVDPEQVSVFKNAIKAQFDLDPNKLTEEEYWQKVAKLQPDFKVIGIKPIEDQALKNMKQCQFEIIREKFALAEIKIEQCYWDYPSEQRWVLRWGEYMARLVWLANIGWNVELCDGIRTKQQAGIWYNFDLNQFLKNSGVNTSAWFAR